MRVVVLGGGVVGVSTAYQLQKDGHEVVVIEREESLAAETSWGNAGMIAPGHSFVWSSPAAPKTLLKSLFLKDQALRFRFSADPYLYKWSLEFLAQCTHERARRNTLLKHRLATYSQKILGEVVAEEDLRYDRNTRGILYAYRSDAAMEAGAQHMKLLESDGQVVQMLDRAGVAKVDPVLGAAPGITGAIYCPTDETGDCAKFTRGLGALVAARGGEIMTGVVIRDLQTDGGTVNGVLTNQGIVRGDAYVLAMGSFSPLLGRRVGISLPIYPVKGYALTVPIGQHKAPPTVGMVDEHNLVAITRFDDRLRITATAQFSGYDNSNKASDFTFMRSVTQALFPDGGDYEHANEWSGLRPMTPTNLPILGRARFANLFCNTGHGHIGWTMSHGSARIVADLIAGRAPAIPMQGLGYRA
ncbi:D-amino acid dehydrogenase [Acetobacter sp. TBRC 12305]|uniref:D-amino acid dehydrogenase n=1 Tax=Acetobacter garciniae TaxID=2817435 RepID=A0A939HQ69_9PROT|nr:D-amino acid dehydrogenase [Acetobacter garciniae]MBO1325474.1 D-amino acid dehydrogenase [Acetobacter garciniae]MBX0345354.1 D-amino acid dehydrogenase [Acetobacter garciniae]